MVKAAASAAAIALLAPAAASADGKTSFEGKCGACHKKDGMGVPGLAPPLANADWGAADKARDYVPLVVLNGMSGKITAGGKPYVSVMPPQKQLKDAEIAEIATYVLSTLNKNAGAPLTEADVAAKRAEKTDHKALLAMRAEMAP
ncbi:MAG: cytochrome c [Rhizobiaceae bacterium]